MKVKLTKEQVDLLISMNAIFTNDSNNAYAYYRLPWAKLLIGSDIAQFYNFPKSYPEDLKRALKNDMCFEQWVWEHSTAGLTEPLDFSQYHRHVDSWSITVDGKETVNPSLGAVWMLYQKAKNK